MSQVEELDILVADLEAAFRDSASKKHIASLLATYANDHQDWRAFALECEEHYTRNLVVRNESFDLLIICWGPGHESPIHNHEGQNCWMAVLDGEMEEAHYAEPCDVNPAAPVGGNSRTFQKGQVAYISDEIALHVVRGAQPEKSAVSLHLYSEPYDACNCYCPETGQITRKPLSNYSSRGRILAGDATP